MKNLYCKLFNHYYVVADDITASVKEYICVKCGKQLTTSDQGELIPLTAKRKEINKELKNLYHKRRKIKNSSY